MTITRGKLGTPFTLSADRIETTHVIADVLVPETEERPSLRVADADARWLTIAFAARRDRERELAALLDTWHRLPQPDVEAALRRLREESRDLFDTISSVVAGAYYMTPAVRELIGYPGQEQRPAPLELAADELSDEIFEGAMAYTRSFRTPDDFVV